MLYQVIFTKGELELLKTSLETTIDYYEECCQDDDAEQVRQLIKSVELGTFEF